MISIKWYKFLLFLLITNLVSVTLCIIYTNCVLLKRERDKHLEFLKEDGQIFVGVVLPESILSGNVYEDHSHAKAFLAKTEDNLWKYIRTENKPFGYQYKVFIFEALPINERLALK